MTDGYKELRVLFKRGLSSAVLPTAQGTSASASFLLIHAMIMRSMSYIYVLVKVHLRAAASVKLE